MTDNFGHTLDRKTRRAIRFWIKLWGDVGFAEHRYTRHGRTSAARKARQRERRMIMGWRK